MDRKILLAGIAMLLLVTLVFSGCIDYAKLNQTAPPDLAPLTAVETDKTNNKGNLLQESIANDKNSFIGGITDDFNRVSAIEENTSNSSYEPPYDKTIDSAGIAQIQQTNQPAANDVPPSQVIEKDNNLEISKETFCSRQPNPGEVKKQEGNIISIVPVEYSDIGEFIIEDSKICNQVLSEYLSIDPPQPLVIEYIISEDRQVSFGGGCGITNYGSRAFYDDFLARIDSYFRVQNNKGICLNLHELTHFFLSGTATPSWANEGLATYLEKRLNPEISPSFTCKENSYVYVEEVEFQKLAPFVWDTQHYHTAACFWDYIEANHGHNKFQKIIQNLKNTGDNAQSFIQTINSSVGEDLSGIISEKFGVTG